MHLLNDEAFIMHKDVLHWVKRKVEKWLNEAKECEIFFERSGTKMKKAGIAGWWKKENYYDESN